MCSLTSIMCRLCGFTSDVGDMTSHICIVMSIVYVMTTTVFDLLLDDCVRNTRVNVFSSVTAI